MDLVVENLNGDVDNLFEGGTLKRVIAQIDVTCSNSLIEAWWRSLTHGWLFLHSLNSVSAVERLVGFYVEQHNTVMPHTAFDGRTSDEVYFGQRPELAGELMEARRRAEHDRRVRWHDLRHSCGTSLNAGWWGRVWSLEEIRDLLGHSSVKVTEIYAHSDWSKLSAPTIKSVVWPPVRGLAFPLWIVLLCEWQPTSNRSFHRVEHPCRCLDSRCTLVLQKIVSNGAKVDIHLANHDDTIACQEGTAAE